MILIFNIYYENLLCNENNESSNLQIMKLFLTLKQNI